MYEYADRYMQLKPAWQKMVVLNIYGGESIFHPDILQILEEVRVRHKKYQDRWPITVTCTTNAVAGKSLWKKIADLIDEFTISFHSTALPKQRKQILDNILYNKSIERRQKIVFVMHNDPAKWDISQEAVEFCKHHNVRYIVKANDYPGPGWQYNKEQYVFFKNYYQEKTVAKSRSIISDVMDSVESETVGMGHVGRSCCGGRKLCGNQDLNRPVAFMPEAGFFDWHCSVNWYFLFIKQVNGNVYYNKDCRMNFDGTTKAIGNLSNTKSILDDQIKLLSGDSIPVIQCKKSLCVCGYCAPKAEKFEDFQKIMKKHTLENVKFLKSIID
jgi:hypothetical protein